MAVKVSDLLPDKAQIDMPVDQSQQMVLRYEIVDLHVVEHLLATALFPSIPFSPPLDFTGTI